MPLLKIILINIVDNTNTAIVKTYSFTAYLLSLFTLFGLGKGDEIDITGFQTIAQIITMLSRH